MSFPDDNFTFFSPPRRDAFQRSLALQVVHYRNHDRILSYLRSARHVRVALRGNLTRRLAPSRNTSPAYEPFALYGRAFQRRQPVRMPTTTRARATYRIVSFRPRTNSCSLAATEEIPGTAGWSSSRWFLFLRVVICLSSPGRPPRTDALFRDELLLTHLLSLAVGVRCRSPIRQHVSSGPGDRTPVV